VPVEDLGVVVVRHQLNALRWSGGGHGAALVLDGDAAERVVLALRVARPVVRHEDAGQGRVAVEDDAEHVPGLALVPVVARVDATIDGMCGSLSGAATSTRIRRLPWVIESSVVDRVQLRPVSFG
jgi:hypothetical protein